MTKQGLKEILNNKENFKLFEELANARELELLPTADLWNIDLEYANLWNANLLSANLQHTDLENDDLEYAELPDNLKKEKNND